ncbi:MAG: hypothetical protein MI747_25080 [Desulfobacterales bacterium]|nr:hypothetical protein [Desulfobacterales bacterium]
MRVGYDIAIKALVTHHKKLVASRANSEALKSVAEGIEYLCYPFREDLTENVPSPLYDPKDGELDPDKEAARKLGIRVYLSEVAWQALEYLRRQGVDC